MPRGSAPSRLLLRKTSRARPAQGNFSRKVSLRILQKLLCGRSEKADPRICRTTAAFLVTFGKASPPARKSTATGLLKERRRQTNLYGLPAAAVLFKSDARKRTSGFPTGIHRSRSIGGRDGNFVGEQAVEKIETFSRWERVL